MDSLSLKIESFGIDISDLSLKIIKLKKRREVLSLASFGEFPVEPGIIKGGEITNEEALVEIIKNSLKKVKGEKINTKYIIASLPEEKAFLQVIKMPLMSEKELKGAVAFEAENYIPLLIDDVYLDFQKIKTENNNVDHFDVLIAALPKNIIDPYVSVFKKAGLKIKALEIESSAISRALIKDEFSKNPLLLIDLGATRISFIVFSGHALRFTSSIPISSQGFTRIISKALKVDLEEAEKLKVSYGLSRKNKKGEEVFDALIPVFTDLIEQIENYIEFYYTHTSSYEHPSPNGKKIEKILLCGGGVGLPGLCEYLCSA